MYGKYKWVDNISKNSQLLLIIIIGLIMGTVFVFGMSYWNEEVDKSECVQSYPMYKSHKYVYDNSTVKEIIIYFSNDELMTIDGVSVNDELINEVEKLDNNSKLLVLKHPNSNTIMEMEANGIILLNYDATMSKLVKERNGFVAIGCFMYLFAVLSVIELFRKNK